MRAAVIVGLSGLELTAPEAAWLAVARPCGIIVFARNCATRSQVRRLVGDALTAIGTADTLVLIDQEGGRVRRLRPPEWRDMASARAIADVERTAPGDGVAAAFCVARLSADELREIGVTVSCAPVLDLSIPGAHGIIGDRAYGGTGEEIVPLASAVIDGLKAGGVVPVIKHIPGHGRALADSHLALPVVTATESELAATDFAPFRALRHAPAAMTAHVVYSAIDATAPASTSSRVIERVIRGRIGFEGLLMSDDLGMQALSGAIGERAAAVCAAGCDVALECSGDLASAQAAAAAAPVLAGQAEERFEACLAVTHRIEPFDRDRAERLARLSLAAEAARGRESV